MPEKGELYDNYIELGLTIAQLSEEYHVSERVVKRWLKAYGIKKHGSDMTLNRAAYVLLNNGFSGRDAATVLNTTHTRVYAMSALYKKWRKRNGYTIQHDATVPRTGRDAGGGD